jgi:hypothetical protein
VDFGGVDFYQWPGGIGEN